MLPENGCQEYDGWVNRTLLVKKRIAVRREIERHKWIESEKAGYDIGWERASLDWMLRHGAGFMCRTPDD